MSSKLLKSTAIVSAMTFVSRVSGLIRDVLMANVLGSGVVSDAFIMAFRIPNLLRRIFGEGAFSQAFVPVFTELTERNTAEARAFVNAMAGMLAVVTLAITILGMVYAPEIIGFYAPGFKDNPEKFAITVDALRFMFPYFFCISLVAMSAGILNTVNRFAIPAVTPVLLNLCMIVAILALVPYLDNAAQALAIGVLCAGFVQLAFQVPSLIREGYFPTLTLRWHNPGMRRVFRLMLPAMFSVSVAQVNMFVNSILASTLVTGSVSWLYYSDRLMEFPVGVFGIALATIVLPSLSKEHTSGSASGFSSMLDWALRWVTVIAVPATFALYILAVPLLSTIFQRGEFSVQDVEMSALALEAFSVGICGFIFVKVLAPGFFARQDTKTPMKIAVVSVVVNVVLSISLIGRLDHLALALAISVAAWVNASLLLFMLLKRRIYSPEPGWFWFLLRVFTAVAVMSAGLLFLLKEPSIWHSYSLLERIRDVVILVSVGGASYLISLFALGIRPHQLLLRPKA